MGLPFPLLQGRLDAALGPECNGANKTIGLVAPYSSVELDIWTPASLGEGRLVLEEMWRHERHLNLDDLDIGREGIWHTVKRVWGRRGLVIWKVWRRCKALEKT